MAIGEIIKIEDAQAYVVKVPPDAKKERIGRFVKITKDDGFIVGVIKNITNSIREDLIPYIEPDMAPKYAPFNSPPDVRDKVEILSREEQRSFHTLDGKPCIAYFNTNRELPVNVLLSMLDQIDAAYPECKAMLKVVRKYIRRSL
jgi:hypothetical protein